LLATNWAEKPQYNPISTVKKENSAEGQASVLFITIQLVYPQVVIQNVSNLVIVQIRKCNVGGSLEALVVSQQDNLGVASVLVDQRCGLPGLVEE
jgi:hypothetical protein